MAKLIFKQISLTETEVTSVETITRFNRWNKMFSLSYCVTSVMSGALYCVRPLMTDFSNKFLLNGNYSYAMPYKSAFFYDETEIPAYGITFLLFCIGTYVTALINVSRII